MSECWSLYDDLIDWISMALKEHNKKKPNKKLVRHYLKLALVIIKEGM